MKKLSKQIKTDMVGYSFILPNIIGTTLFVILPLIFTLVISFTNWDFISGFKNVKFFGLTNYIEQWGDEWFVSSFTNTILYAVVVVPVTVFVSLILAVQLEKYAYAKPIIKLAVFMPYISNIVAISIVWKMMYAPWGPFTQLVKLLGWSNPPAWLGSYTWALPALMLVGIWGGVGYCIMIYSSAIQALPMDVYEAAEVDGATQFQQLFKITIPR